jgi:small-conductance mechanosensitive channel
MTDELNTSWSAVFELVSRLLGAGLVLLATFLVARFLQRLCARLLRGVGFDDVLERTGSTSSLRRVGFAGAPSMLIDLIVVLAGKALVAVLILAGGLAVAGWLSNLAAHEAEAAGLRGGDLFRRAIFAAVLAVAALLAAAQLGIDILLLILLAAVLFGTVGLVVALSLGVGLAPLSGNIAAGRYVQGNDIQVGDEISVDGVAGIIENLGYASVTLRSEDGSLHHVPNRVLLEGIVTKRVPRD